MMTKLEREQIEYALKLTQSEPERKLLKEKVVALIKRF
jgi:hypothetical protein